MLKFTGRFLFFLAVSVALAAGIYALVQRSPGSLGLSSQFRSPGDREFNGERFQGQTVGDTDIFMGRREMGLGGDDLDFDGRGGLAFGLLGIGKNLLIIALITLVVVGLQKMNKINFRKRSVKAV